MGSSDEYPIGLRLRNTVFHLDTLELTDLSGNPIAVRKQSLRVLCQLAEQNGRTVDKDELIDAAWNGRSVSDDNLVQCIKDIRYVIGDTDRSILRTAVGRGYSLHGKPDMRNASGTPPKLLISRMCTDTSDAELAELANVITEELIVTLTPRAGLAVTVDQAQSSSVQYVLDGRVGRSEENLHAFVQIAKRKTGDVVFAKQWKTLSAESGCLPWQIAERVGNALRIHMFNYDGEDYLSRNNSELDTQELMAKAAYHMSRIQMENRDAAREALSLAIKREPNNAMALAMRASAAVLSILQESHSKLPDPPEYCMELANRALSLAPHIDFVNRTRGSLRLWLNADHEGARADCKRALQITPVFHLAHQTIALSEILSGEHAAGIERVQKIMELGSSSNPRYPHYLAMLALGQVLAGHVGRAAASAREAHERSPKDPWCRYVYAAAAAGQPDVTSSAEFKRMIADTDLPISHFRDLAFTDLRDVDMLEERLSAVGYSPSL